MELVLYVIGSWLVVAYWITFLKRKEIIVGLILYFILTMLLENYFTITALNLEYIRISKEVDKFLSFLLFRDIIAPVITLICINSFFKSGSFKKTITVIVLLLIIVFTETVNLRLQIYSYVQWSFGMSIIIYILYIFIALVLGKSLRIIQVRGEHE